jgi:hypothetical protein
LLRHVVEFVQRSSRPNTDFFVADDLLQEARSFRRKQAKRLRAEREVETQALLEAFRYRSTRTTRP